MSNVVPILPAVGSALLAAQVRKLTESMDAMRLTIQIQAQEIAELQDDLVASTWDVQDLEDDVANLRTYIALMRAKASAKPAHPFAVSSRKELTP